MLKTNLHTGDDFQMLRFILESRNNSFIITKYSPWSKEAKNLSLFASTMAFDLRLRREVRLAFQCYPVMGLDGTISIVSPSDINYYYYVNKRKKYPTVNLLQSSLLRVITSLKEAKIGDDEPFWPFFMRYTQYNLMISSLTNTLNESFTRYYLAYSRTSTEEKTSKYINESKLENYLREAVFFKSDPSYVNSHPFTLKKLQDFYQRLNKGITISNNEIDPFEIAQRSNFIQTFIPVLNAADEFTASLKTKLPNVTDHIDKHAVHTFIGEALSPIDIVYDKCRNKIEKRIIEKIAVHYNCRYFGDSTPKISEFLNESIFSKKCWTDFLFALHCIQLDEEFPDVRYFIAELF